MKRRISVLLLTSLLICGGCSSSQDEPVESGLSQTVENGQKLTESEEDNVYPAEQESMIVKVEAGSFQGSGVIYAQNENSLVLITAAHVLEQEKEKVIITFFDHLVVESVPYYISEDSDLAFINVPLSSIPKNRLENYLSVQVDQAAFDSIESGAEVDFVAWKTDSASAQEAGIVQDEANDKGTVLESWTYVEDFQQYMMLLRGEILPGMSGGGVFDEAGNFLGILCGGGEEQRIAVVPLNKVLAEYSLVYE